MQDMSKTGPQITARPGTKRHLRQCAARAGFFNVKAGNVAAHARRTQDKIDVVTMLILAVSPVVGRA